MRLTSLVALCLLILPLAACQPAAEPQPAPAPAAETPSQDGPPATENEGGTPGFVERTAEQPAFAATAVDGSAYDLAAHRGRWVVVNFWATWCAPCLKEMPELSALYTGREDVEVVGLAYEDTTVEDMRAFLAQHPVAYPVVIIDPLEPPQDFETPRGLPTTYLIAPDGRVARQFVGPVTAEDLETAIAAGAAS